MRPRIQSKPRVGVSACLLGQPVRYDGDARPHAWICKVLPRHAQILPFCPETGAGLTIPRPPVHLVQMPDGAVRALGVENPDLDVTGLLQAWSLQQKQLLQSLDALVLKSRSPSCGLETTPLFDPEGVLLKSNHDGIYAAWVKTHYPELLLCDELQLEETADQVLFLDKLQKKSRQ